MPRRVCYLFFRSEERGSAKQNKMKIHSMEERLSKWRNTCHSSKYCISTPILFLFSLLRLKEYEVFASISSQIDAVDRSL